MHFSDEELRMTTIHEPRPLSSVVDPELKWRGRQTRYSSRGYSKISISDSKKRGLLREDGDHVAIDIMCVGAEH